MYVYVKFSGKMKDLPDGLPQFTIDLKQFLDYFGIENFKDLGLSEPENEHEAICDAKWNLKLFKAIKNKFGVNI